MDSRPPTPGAVGSTARAQAKDRSYSADRALEILGMFDDQHPILTAREVSERLGMSRSTTYRYLQSLKSSGFIDQGHPESGFGIGSRIHELARLARRTVGLSEVILPVMNEMASQLGETVLFSRLVGGHVVCFERVEASRPIRLSYERGQVLPVNAGASAKVLLAAMCEREVDALLALEPLRSLTPAAATDPRLFKRDLARIREDGFAVSHGEADEGVLGVAAPVCHSGGHVSGSLAVAAPEYRTPATRVNRIVTVVVDAANTISRELQSINS